MALTGIWYVIGFAFAAGSFTFLTFGAAWLLGLVFMLFISALFGLLGGLFGALMFGKDALPPPPPPPQGPTFTPPTFSPPPLPRGDA